MNLDLESLKYAELRQLAKDVGLKANMKVNLLKQKLDINYQLTSANKDDNEFGKEEPVIQTFVTKRRGRGRTTGTIKFSGIKKEDMQVIFFILMTDFKRLHEANFKKMESIDSYIERKKKKLEENKNYVKEIKLLSISLQKSENRSALFSPTPLERRRTVATPSFMRKSSRISAIQTEAGAPDGFKPSIFSTKKMNVRFSEATKNNEYKYSLAKTPARMSLSAEKSKHSSATRASRTSKLVTPFKFEGDATKTTVSTPATNKKPTFDLRASLARPLTYQPHKGKLKPFLDSKENAGAENTTLSHKKNYKQHQPQTSDDRHCSFSGYFGKLSK
uniref:Nucleolar and spindle associated protein 1 n=1 Tax=Erpetoichthys calabaricus TaxID=27687 RepID=A0A8C4SMS3_ERPCA